MRGAHSKTGSSIWTEPADTTSGLKTVAVLDDQRPNNALHIYDAEQLEEFINLLISCAEIQGWDTKHKSTWPLIDKEPKRGDI